MSRRAWNWAATSTRLVVGAALATGIVLTVGVGVAAPWPRHEIEPLSIAVTPTPTDTVLSCAGDVLALGRDATQASGITVAASAEIIAGADGSELSELVEDTAPTVLGGGGATVLVAEPEGDARSDAAGASSVSVAEDDLRGFSAAACQPALIESWLVGGATTTGSADLILLSNPSDVVATVDLTLYGATGASTPPGGAALRIDAHTQRIVPLAALGVGEEAPVVRVTASGAPVAAMLQSSLTRTLTPGGVDQTGAVVGAQATQVVPGVQVPESAVASAEVGATTLLRLLAPGADTSATVTVHDDDGDVALEAEVPLSADLVTELDLTGLDAGTYTVSVDAAAAVVAAVWQTTGFGDGADFAWYTAAETIEDATLVAVPEGPEPTLVVAATMAGPAQVELEAVDGDAETERLTVAAGESASVPLEAGVVYRLSAGAPIRAAVSFLGDGAISGFAVWPADAAAGQIVVHP